MSNLNTVMTREEFKAVGRELVTPIDFDALLKAGVLEKDGAWYRVLKMDELPSHATRKVKAMKLDKGQKVICLKFYKVNPKLTRIVENMKASQLLIPRLPHHHLHLGT
jgi:hypothetical protein